MARVRQRFSIFYSLASLSGILLGCSANAGTGTSGEPQSGMGGGGAVTSSSGGSTTIPSGGGGSAGAGGSTVMGFGTGSTTSASTGGTDGGACAATSASAEQTTVTKTVRSPVAIVLVQDRSGSMKDTPAGASTSKWNQTTTADNAFVTDPNSAGLDVALTFFPASGGACDGTGYMNPTVPLARLPSQQQAQAVATALTNNAPGGGNVGGGGTPLEGGLRGGEDYCLQFEANNPTEPCVVVLITDGAPNGCSNDQTVLSGIASDAKAQAAASGGTVLTFTIGMNGADFNLLDAIAVAGGGNCDPGTTGMEACNVDTNGTSLVEALNLIRTTVTKTQVIKTALPCEYSIPDPGMGQVFDRTKVNVQFTNGTGGTEKFLQVPDSTSCADHGGQGWYYDNPTTPQKVELCPSTCTEVSGSSDGGTSVTGTAPQVDVLFGCQTLMAGPS